MSPTRRQIAFFSPLPPERSGIADYSAELLPYLARWADITLFATEPDHVVAALHEQFPIRSIVEYEELFWDFDLALHQMGASMFHDVMYPVLLRHGGVVTLHEHSLHQFIATRTIPQGNFAGFVREMGYALGAQGVGMAYEIRRGQREHPFAEVHLVDRLLDRSLGIIVHSRYVQDQLRSLRPRLRTMVIPAPIEPFAGPLLSRRELGWPEEALLFVSAGQVIQSKQLPLALQAFARLRQDFPTARYVVVGDELPNDLDLPAWLAEHGFVTHVAGDAVAYAGYCENLSLFQSWIAAADVLVNLRFPTAGETSATALRGLAAARPVIVSDHGWYAELPDDVCVKVPPNDLDALLTAMRRLASDSGLRHTIGERAAAYARTEHAPARAAERYMEFIDQVLTSAPGVQQRSAHG